MKVKFRKKRRILIRPLVAVFAILAVIGGSSPFVLSVSPQLEYQNILTQAAASPVWPAYGSGAVKAVELNKVITSHGEQTARPIASITKVVTALVVLDKKPLISGEDGPSIELTQADLDIYYQGILENAAVQPVIVGNVISERQAIELMMMPSSCNYAETLARWAYGSQEAYVTAANAWLANNGLGATKVVDASGLNPGNVSNPTDLISLGEMAISNPALATIVSTKQTIIAGVGEINNTNELIGQLGVDGIKTGWTDEAGACLLFSSVIDVDGQSVRIVGVLLDGDVSTQVAGDVANLLNSIKPGFKLVRLIVKDQVYGTYSTVWGQQADLVASDGTDLVVWSDTPITVSVSADKTLFIKDGKEKGTVEVKVGDKIFEQPLKISK